jgi:hypothetical protein
MVDMEAAGGLFLFVFVQAVVITLALIFER